ncbi:alpha-2-macroglobulin domain protein [Vulgatibacter incomptus]|uniref:Alpha-2-macroglobulin domain protein n=2 Tax=Vulgatibacter incomptus TaxID=1391653 RepID=A0A0K1P945_9BACT|nr:alpha-2-macroglobulin domain protein [Vulgatibacter incomptus]
MMKAAETTVKTPARGSSSALGFRLSNADDGIQAIEERKVAAAMPLGKEDAARLLARLPKLAEQPGDAASFSLRARSIPAPRPGVTIDEAFPPIEAPPAVVATPTGPLSVDRYAPEGEVPIAPNVSVTFSEPMVPITSIGELSKESVPARISPEPEGEWRWLGTRTLVFQPTKRMPMATSFSVTVPEGTRAISGQALADEVKWSFTTPPPALESWLPKGSSVSLEPVLFAAFDQAIDPAAMFDNVEIIAGDAKIPARLATQDEIDADEGVRRAIERADEGRWFAFRPERRLPNGTRVRVRIAEGTRGAEGPLPTTKEQSFDFETFGPLNLRQTKCGWDDRCTPYTPFVLRFSNELDGARFDPELVTVSPEIPGMKVSVDDHEITIRGRTKGRTDYAVAIHAALTDVFGQTLDTTVPASFSVGPAVPRLFGPEGEMVVLDPAAPRQYVAYSINEEALRTRVYAVTPEDWRAFASWRSPWSWQREGAPPGRLVVDEVVRPQAAPDDLAATPIDLSAALDHGLGHAVVWVNPARTRKGYEYIEDVVVWVQATELGIQAFLEPDRATAWVTNLADGAPLDGVEVSLLGAGPAVPTKNGLATLPLVHGGYPLVAKRGRDTAFLTEGRSDTETFVQHRYSRAPRWLVFDDRGMYKPSEKVHVKGWLRVAELSRGGDLVAAPPDELGESVKYLVRDPRGAELTGGLVTIDEHGAFDLAFDLPANVNLGEGEVELELIGSSLPNTWKHRFSIQEFRKPEFEVKTRVGEGPYFGAGHAIASVVASYYAGGGLPNAPVDWTITQNTTSFTPPHQRDYHFGPESKRFWWWRGPGGEGGRKEWWSARTDAAGVHSLRLDFDAREPAYPISLSLASSVEDVNRQRWSGRASMLVHQSDRYVGLRLAKNFVRAGEPLAVELVVADLDGALIGGRPIEVRSARLESTRRGMEHVEQEVDVQRCEVKSSSDAMPLRCSLETKGGGLYRVTAVVTDEQGRRNQSTIETWVMGGDGPKRSGVDADRLTVIPDKNEYLPGETATLLVISPLAPAEGVLTVRRQGVVHLERFTMREPSQTLQVALDDAMVPNVSISVDLVGAALREGADGEADTSSPRRPAYASGSAEVKVLPSTRTLKVKATPKALSLSPGGSTTIDLEVYEPSGRPAKNAEVAVIVVDEAVLALSGYETPDPLAVFYADRSADVRALGNRENVILGEPAVEPGRRGGGEGGRGLGLGGLGARGASAKRS